MPRTLAIKMLFPDITGTTTVSPSDTALHVSTLADGQKRNTIIQGSICVFSRSLLHFSLPEHFFLLQFQGGGLVH